MDTVLNVRQHLQRHWQVDVETEQVKMMLVHIASALGRIKRGHRASPLYADFLAEIQSAVIFPQVLIIHQYVLEFALQFFVEWNWIFVLRFRTILCRTLPADQP